MNCDQQRLDRIQTAIRSAGWEALACSLPTNVLMLTGYWPVIGTSIAIITREGRVGLVAPEDEQELAQKSWAHELQTFKSGSLDEIQTVPKAVGACLAQMAAKLGLAGVIGCELEDFYEPASYAAMHFYGGLLPQLIAQAVTNAKIVPADTQLSRLRSIKTAREISHLRRACRIAQAAYENGVKNLCAGATETEVAADFRKMLSIQGVGFEEVERADGFTYCMSGPHSAQAYAAYQRSRARVLTRDDLVLVHCNSYADGFWTDITRTFCLGSPNDRQQKMYEAVLEARQAALQEIKPGAKCSAVDSAARDVLHQHHFGPEFKHGCGHGVGLAAINHTAPPRIHPASQERLETGMVFNIEPGIYIAGWGGMRHCDMVAVTENGAELLTPFQSRPEDLVILELVDK